MVRSKSTIRSIGSIDEVSSFRFLKVRNEFEWRSDLRTTDIGHRYKPRVRLSGKLGCDDLLIAHLSTERHPIPLRSQSSLKGVVNGRLLQGKTTLVSDLNRVIVDHYVTGIRQRFSEPTKGIDKVPNLCWVVQPQDDYVASELRSASICSSQGQLQNSSDNYPTGSERHWFRSPRESEPCIEATSSMDHSFESKPRVDP